MYISKIKLHNIKCFEDATINLEDANAIFRGCLILGGNGMGKTTILRLIAMSLSGKSSASGLLDDMPGGVIRNKEKEGYVLLMLKSDDGKQHFSIKTTFGRENGGANIVTEQATSIPNENQINPNQETSSNSAGFPWEEIFVCGYGAARGIRGDGQYDEYAVPDAVYSLFALESGYLQNPEVSLRRTKDLISDELFQKLLNWVDSVLMLPKGSVTLKKGAGIFVKDPWGISRPIGTIADGYHATLSMICDLFGWALFYDKEIFEKGLSGIVMIDEIDQHLHLVWQRKIIGNLIKVFSKIQFIMTTHSPLIAGNAGKLFDAGNGLKLFYTGRKDEKAEISEIEENLGELGCDQILSSEAFGHISNLNINQQVEKLLKEASILAAKDQRTPEENTKYDNFKKKLKELMFPEGKTLIERVTEREFYKEMEHKIDEFNKILRGGNSSDKN